MLEPSDASTFSTFLSRKISDKCGISGNGVVVGEEEGVDNNNAVAFEGAATVEPSNNNADDDLGCGGGGNWLRLWWLRPDPTVLWLVSARVKKKC